MATLIQLRMPASVPQFELTINTCLPSDRLSSSVFEDAVAGSFYLCVDRSMKVHNRLTQFQRFL